MKTCMVLSVEDRIPVGTPRRLWFESVEADMVELHINRGNVHDRKKCYEEEVHPHWKTDYKPMMMMMPEGGSKRHSLRAVELSQWTQAAVQIVSNLPAPSNRGPIDRVLGMPAMRTRWMAGAAAHKSG